MSAQLPARMLPNPDHRPFVDPDTVPIIAASRAAPPVDYATREIGEARGLFLAANAGWNTAPPELSRIDELQLRGAAGAMRARLYRPLGARDLPVIVFVHGGGWTFGNVDSHDRCTRLLALETGAAVIAFDYRLAPEHPFPAALEDTQAVLGGLAELAPQFGLDPRRVAVAGDSAGANIALAALLARRAAGASMPAAAALFYGCYAPIFDTESHRRFGDGSFILSTQRMRWYWRNYLGSLPEDTTALAAPLRADLSRLPAMFLNAAGLDPLLDDTMILASRLAHAGSPIELDVVPGVVHGFLQQTRDVAAARRALARAGRFLAGHLRTHARAEQA